MLEVVEGPPKGTADKDRSKSRLPYSNCMRVASSMCEGLRKLVRALRECPHLRIEIWGTRFVAR
jgi:hypothetical protein